MQINALFDPPSPTKEDSAKPAAKRGAAHPEPKPAAAALKSPEACAAFLSKVEQAQMPSALHAMDGYPEEARLAYAHLIFKKMESSLLPDAVDSLKRVPDALRDRARVIVDNVHRHHFARLVAQITGSGAPRRDASRTIAMLAQSAKLLASQAASSLGGQPWHLADDAAIKVIGAEIRKTGRLDGAAKHLITDKTINLFVAAVDRDDRDSYIKSVISTMQGRHVHNLVFDGEIIEWFPTNDFLEACVKVGLPPTHVGISDRRLVGQHAMLMTTSSQHPTPALFVDTDGRPFNLQAQAALVGKTPAAGAACAPNPGIQEKIQSLRKSTGRTRP